MPVRQSRLQKLLLRTRNQEPVLFSRTSISQQTDGSDESKTVEDHQSSIGRGNRHMARGISKCPIGIQDHREDFDKRDATQTHLRHKSSNTSQGRSHQHKKKGFLGRWQ